jgi:hypothetical protein
MTNAEINKKFLAAVDAKSKDMILSAIAKHYGITPAEMYDELIDVDAENVLDYMVEPERSAAYVLYQRHGFKL